MTQSISTFFSDRLVRQKGSGSYVIVGAIIIILGSIAGAAIDNIGLIYASAAVGAAIVIASFLMIIKQYERAVILRLGRFQRQVGPGVQTRFPFADSILVVDIREKVREFKAERML